MIRMPPGFAFSRCAACVLVVSATAGSVLSVAAPPTAPAAPLRLLAEGFSVEVPAGKRWSCTTPGPSVHCFASVWSFLWPNAGSLRCERVDLAPRDWRLSEDAVFDAWVAEDFRWSDAEDVERGRVVIEGRSFRFVRYRQGSLSRRTYVAQFAWFPEDIGRTHIYYRFTETLDWESFGRPKMGTIEAMLRTFQIDDPVAAATGPNGELLRAAVKGDADAVARALVDGASPDARAGRDGALAIAAFYGHAAIVRALVDAGASIDGTMDEMERPPLVAAISGGEVAIARALVEWGADVKVRPARGRTPITAAAEYGQVPTLRLLGERGAPVNEIDAGEPPRSSGRSPLARASLGGHVEAVRTLLELGADPNVPADPSNRAALRYAVAAGYREIAAVLLAAGAQIDHRPPKGRTALHEAVGLWNVEMARFLLEKGANPDIDDGQETPLQTAASRDSGNLVKLLLDAGADPNRKVEGSGQTAWSLTWPNYVAARQLLREAGAVPEEGGRLHEAVKKGDLEGIRRALAAGADVNAKDDELGWTPLHVAAYGNKEAAALLLEWGADVNARDRSNDTPLAVAIFWNQLDVAVLLLEHGADPNAPGTYVSPPLFHAAAQPAPDAVRALLAHGADPGMTDSSGATALHYAAMGRQRRMLRRLEGTQGFLVIIDALIDAGADVNASSDDGATPLHIAAGNDEGKIIRRLLARGANPQARDSDGWTPLDCARRGHHKSAVAALESASGKSEP